MNLIQELNLLAEMDINWSTDGKYKKGSLKLDGITYDIIVSRPDREIKGVPYNNAVQVTIEAEKINKKHIVILHQQLLNNFVNKFAENYDVILFKVNNKDFKYMFSDLVVRAARLLSKEPRTYTHYQKDDVYYLATKNELKNAKVKIMFS